ncbi:MAG: zinc ribbon domain-containing protein [Lachnospiraceae bacterium]|nr:zinc ribbon domain-containing protein [Lachnospiraceae bacterium]
MIFLILLLIVILAIFCGILYVRHKAKEFSRTIFGTEDLSDGIRQMKREYASTPKSVSGMTNLLLPKIVSDFPDFEYDEMKERAENTLTQYLRAVTQKNTAVLTDGNTELKQQLENHIQMLSIKGLWEHFDQIKIHRTEIHQYKKANGRCIITFQSALECFHYITDISSVIEGSKEYKYQTKYNTDLIYIQDRNLLENELDHALGINCPNCGAPLSSLGAKKCEYCGTPVIEINIHAWSFSDIKEMN